MIEVSRHDIVIVGGGAAGLRAAIAAIESDPEESPYYTSLSRFLQMQGKIPEAEEAAANAMRLQARQPL